MDWKSFFNENNRIIHSSKDINSKIEEFIQNGASVNDKDKNHATPLHLASKCGYFEVIKILIRKEADVNAINHCGRTPLFFVFQENTRLLWPHLLEIETRIASFLIKKGAKVDIKDFSNITPLHLATKYGNLESVKILVENGADINFTSNFRERPIHLACEKGYLEILNIFISKGVDINVLDFFSRNCLHIVVQRNDLQMAKVLLDNYIDVNLLDRDGRTPMDLACLNKKDEMIKLFKKNARYMLDKKSKSLDSKDSSNENPITLSQRVKNLLNIQ